MLSRETQDFLFQHIQSIKLCLDNGLIGPTLILAYVGIDAFGALGRPKGKRRNPREDFVNWAQRYLIVGDFPPTGLELYGARCALLHNLSGESELSRKGRIRPVFYAWGDR